MNLILSVFTLTNAASATAVTAMTRMALLMWANLDKAGRTLMQDALKFVTLVGSVRRQSSILALANTLDELAPDDVEVTVLDSIGFLPHFSDDPRAHATPREVVAMGSAIAKADAVVLVTPERGVSVPGALLNALDWLAAVPSCPLASKPVAIQAASTGPLCGPDVEDHLRQILRSLRAVVLEEPRVNVPNIDGKVDADTSSLRDEGTRRSVRSQLAALAELARQRGNHRSPS